MVVPPALHAKPLDRVIRELFGLSWNGARDAIRSGKVFREGAAITDPQGLVGKGDTLEIRPNAPRPHIARRDAFAQDRILLADQAVVVVNKPAGISTVPFGDEDPAQERATLDALVRDVLARSPRGGRAPLGVVHRLDKDTSGVLVFTRTVAAKKHLANQFRHHTTERRYVAIVHGRLDKKRTLRSFLVEDRGDGIRGSARPGQKEGQLAITHVTPLEKLRGATLVECQLETGRTHQIRIHLSEAGHPLAGERVYIRGYRGERIQAPRLMLHARMLGFEHPTSEERVAFEAPPPEDFERVLSSLQER
ncbi:MAG: RluA family pseudouridine synthase [Polyangiaceae bacterium]|nr:RluA family pseudouridine synthase [Polyangiaceae bacterium]